MPGKEAFFTTVSTASDLDMGLTQHSRRSGNMPLGRWRKERLLPYVFQMSRQDLIVSLTSICSGSLKCMAMGTGL